MTDFIDNPVPFTAEGARDSLRWGAKLAFDMPDSWHWDGDDDFDSESLPAPAPSWQVAAARGIINNLQGRRGIKYELQIDRIDEDVRQEIVLTLAAIIEAAPEWYAEQQKDEVRE